MNGIYNYLKYDENLSSSGMPTPEQLKEAAEAGARVVINLATSKSEGAIPNEAELVAGLGMEYIHIPVEWNEPTRRNLDDFLQAMDEHKGKHVLVHCQANFRATGFVALYRILKLGWKKEEAFRDLRRIWDPEDYPAWQTFIETHLLPW